MYYLHYQKHKYKYNSFARLKFVLSLGDIEMKHIVNSLPVTTERAKGRDIIIK